MKSIKTRLVSAFLLIMTILSLFPTSAFAASGTGKGITITKDQAYWTTARQRNAVQLSSADGGGKAALLPRQRPRLPQRYAVIL